MARLARGSIVALLALSSSCSRVGCKREDEPAPPARDEIVTALVHFRDDIAAAKTPAARAVLAQRIVEVSDLHDAAFAARGDVYHHHPYPEPSFDCLEAGTCFADYLQFQIAAEASEFGRPAPADREGRVARLAGQLTVDALRAELDRHVAWVARKLEGLDGVTYRGPSSAKRTVFVVSTGHAIEVLRDAAIARVLADFPGEVRFGELTPAKHAALLEPLGHRLTAAAFVDGKLHKDVVHLEQWLELLFPDRALPPAARKSPLPIFDAHAHVTDGGTERLRSILVDERLAGAVVAALPRSHATGVDATGIDASNALVLGAASKTAPVVVPFVTLDEAGPDPLAAMRELLGRGAAGLKLITGHDDHHRAKGRPELDGPKLRAVFAELASRGVPVLWHVNSHLYARGFLRVLRDFPKLTIVNPHLAGYLSYAPAILRKLLERYPNLYVDLSVGGQARYVRRSIEDLSARRDEWRRLILDHPDRFLFGVDTVVGPTTSRAHARMVYRTMTAMLEEERFDLHWFPPAGSSTLADESHHVDGLRGLSLPQDVLRKIYFDNAVTLYRIETTTKSPG